MLRRVIIVKIYGFSVFVFFHGFKLQNSVCNACHELTILCPSFRDVGAVNVI